MTGNHVSGTRVLGRSVALLAAALLLSGQALFGQGLQTGVLMGTVADTGGGVLPGTTVIVRSPALQGERSTVTDTNGVYTLRGLPPGTYTVTFDFPDMSPATDTIVVPLGDTARLDATLAPAAVAETITVTAASPTVLTTAHVGANYTSTEIGALPAPRTLAGIAELAPGLTTNTPNTGQVTISGAFAYDNVFLVDGVDVNDNLFGTANNLFIEDAIEETQILTSGISAEYGRFQGGIINAITKSGGNNFSGSYRLNFTNPSWTGRTPHEVRNDITRDSELSQYHEATLGGPVLLDRLWFFGAGRFEDSSVTSTFPETGGPVTRTVDNKRAEIKLTGTVAPAQTVAGTFLNNATGQTQPTFDFTIDPNVMIDRTLPNHLWVVNYNGVVSPTLFATAQVSRKHFGFRNSGGTSTDPVDSPYLSRGLLGVPSTRHYNAPYFDSTDPEDRNNLQVAGSLSHFRSTAAAGTHDLKAGFEHFTSTRIGGNSQSATGFVFSTDYKNVGGTPVIENGRLVPLFVPGHSRVTNWMPTRGAQLDLRTLSLYAHDRWALNRHVTFDLGVRYERVRGEATGDIVTADTDTIVPRLAASYDLRGDGRVVLQSTYAHYSGKYSEAQFGRITPVGTPSSLTYEYTGPAGEGRDFAPGLDLANYRIIGGSFPLATVFFDDNLSSPTTREFTLSAGGGIGPDGWAKLIYSRRRVSGFIESFVTMDTGQTTVVHDGINFGTFDNTLYRNTSEPSREYDAVQLQSRWQFSPRWFVNGHWTVQLTNHGSFEGENPNQPGFPSNFGLYPEILVPGRNDPYGRLDDFQQHKVRLWTVFNQGLGMLGSTDVALMYRFNSARTYSLVASGVPLSAIQLARNPGYARLPGGGAQTVYFGERGTESFAAEHLFDVSLNYAIPVWRSLRPWLKVEVYNLFNNDRLTSWDRTVTANMAGPVDEHGIPTTFNRGARFGEGTSNAHYPRPRTFQMAFGLRF